MRKSIAAHIRDILSENPEATPEEVAVQLEARKVAAPMQTVRSAVSRCRITAVDKEMQALTAAQNLWEATGESMERCHQVLNLVESLRQPQEMKR